MPQVSSNYVVGKDGSIGLSVEEKNRAWTSSNASNDHRAITIEVACDSKAPYAVTDKAMAALIELVADICKRNNIKQLKWKGDKSLIGQVDKQNMTVHQWFANTACPGEYLYKKHSYIAEQVNKKLGVTTTKPEATKPAATNSELYRVRKTWKDAESQIGAYSSLENAKKACKSGYFVFDSKGNAVYPVVTTASTSKAGDLAAGTKLALSNVALYASSSATAKASTKSGTYYVWSKDIVNNRIRITNSKENAGKSNKITGWIAYTDAKKFVSTASTKSLDDWAREVINGKHGNGIIKRTSSLKKAGCPYSYVKVQSRVNALLKK